MFTQHLTKIKQFDQIFAGLSAVKESKQLTLTTKAIWVNFGG